MVTKWIFSYFILAGTPLEPLPCPTLHCSAYTIVESKQKCEESIAYARSVHKEPLMIVASCVELGAGVTATVRELTSAERLRATLKTEEKS